MLGHILASTCGNSTACCLVTKPGSHVVPISFIEQLVAPPPPPPLQHTPGGSLLSMLKTLNTLINIKEVTNYLKWGVNQGVIATRGRRDRVIY